MATPKGQRIGILIITIVMIVGTLGSFIVMIIANENARKDQIAYQKYQEEYQKKIEAYKKKLQVQSDEMSTKYYPIFSPYATRVGAFDRDSVKELKTEDLLVGDGDEIKDGTKYAAYYIGWTADGKIFDQSIAGDKLKAPFDASAGAIKGWVEGVKGMKIGGVRQLTIPSEKAYGDKAQTNDQGKETIPANSPLQFIVMAVPTPPEIPFN